MIQQLNLFTRQQNVHSNSRKCYAEERPKLGKRAEEIVKVWERYDVTTLTDRDIMEMLYFKDMNSVRPRITELIKAGLLRECGSTIDSVTGKKVRLVCVA